jgi:undecaprenyl diphosphate synthase
VDLLIRTGKEQRISNFLLWHIAYAEIIFQPKYWPEYTVKTFYNDLDTFAKRERRFGTIK